MKGQHKRWVHATSGYFKETKNREQRWKRALQTCDSVSTPLHCPHTDPEAWKRPERTLSHTSQMYLHSSMFAHIHGPIHIHYAASFRSHIHTAAAGWPFAPTTHTIQCTSHEKSGGRRADEYNSQERNSMKFWFGDLNKAEAWLSENPRLHYCWYRLVRFLCVRLRCSYYWPAPCSENGMISSGFLNKQSSLLVSNSNVAQ